MALTASYRRAIGAGALLLALPALVRAIWAAASHVAADAGLASTLLSLLVICAVIAAGWRSAERSFGAVRFALFAGCLMSAAAALAQLGNGWAATAAAPPRETTAPMALELRGTRLMIRGEIGFELFNAAERSLAAHPEITTVVLNSPGGRIPAARGLARLLQERGLDSHVEQLCASACTLVFAAGTTRTMDADARIGFHGYALDSTVATLDLNAEQARDLAYFIARGAAPDFMAKAYATAHSDMWFPDPQTLVQAGILSAYPAP